MKPASLVLSLLVVILSVAALVPSLQSQAQLLTGATAVLALLLVGLIAATRSATAGEPTAQEPVPAPVEPAKPAPAPVAAPRAEAEVISLLAALQDKGRFVDFVMDDITAYDDSQVGAAARVVHQGCRAVFDEHFSIEPVDGSGEGSQVTVPASDAADRYRLTGNLAGQAPFNGTLNTQRVENRNRQAAPSHRNQRFELAAGHRPGRGRGKIDDSLRNLLRHEPVHLQPGDRPRNQQQRAR